MPELKVNMFCSLETDITPCGKKIISFFSFEVLPKTFTWYYVIATNIIPNVNRKPGLIFPRLSFSQDQHQYLETSIH